MKNNKRMMVLGGSFLQSIFINKAVDLGFELLVLDGNCDCYVSQWSNIKFIHADFSNYEQVKNIAIDYNPSMVYAPSNEIGNIIAAKLASVIGYSYNSIEVVQSSLDKKEQRQIASNCDLLYSPGFIQFKGDLNEVERCLDYPMIIKPSKSSASRGVSSACNRKELEVAIETASEYLGIDGVIIVEEFLQGDQISVETVSVPGQHFIAGITKEELSGQPYFIERSHKMNAEVHNKYFELVEQKVYQLLNEFGVMYGPCHIELVVSQDKVALIEIATRAGGWRDGLMACAGYGDYNERILNAYINKKINKVEGVLPRKYGLVNILMSPEDLSSVLLANDAGVLSKIYYNQKPPIAKPKNLINAYGYAYMSSKESLNDYALKNEL
ncbi:ATP-grasp domain-containing protein [bacterium]|nr:ATP-grasp domain-containing protein [bacterium]